MYLLQLVLIEKDLLPWNKEIFIASSNPNTTKMVTFCKGYENNMLNKMPDRAALQIWRNNFV